MLHINDLTCRVAGRLLIDQATLAIASGHKVGLVGRNGAGKTTLLRIIKGELSPEAGAIKTARHARIVAVDQEAPGDERSLIDTVLAADVERASLIARADTETDGEALAHVHTRLADIDAHSAPARAATILAGLGFADASQQGPTRALSGGWRMRVALAAALFAEPDVLLLDEPTNYLDLEGVIWLGNFLKGYRHTVLIVSHDRDLLNAAVDAIAHLEGGKLTLYPGGYDDFERRRAEAQALSMKLRKKQEASRRHMEAFVERFRYKASKARQAQSRLKALARLTPPPDLVEERTPAFHFPAPSRTMSPPLMRLEDVAVGYGDGPDVLAGIELRLDPDDRIALLGANGNGKSTFAKLITGRLAPRTGHLRHHKKIEIAYFAQHQLDELNPVRTPYEVFCDLMPEATQAQRRARLGQYGFGANHADTATKNLSGGEKARLLFAVAAFAGAHLLVLDEPTNHLDMGARQALMQAINDYPGAVVLITHDRHLIETCAERLWLVDNGTVTEFDGNLDDYARRVLAATRERSPARRRAGSSRRQSAQPATATPPNPVSVAHRLADLSRRIDELAGKIAVLDEALADPRLYERDPARAGDYSRLRARLGNELERAETDWLKMSDTGCR